MTKKKFEQGEGEKIDLPRPITPSEQVHVLTAIESGFVTRRRQLERLKKQHEGPMAELIDTALGGLDAQAQAVKALIAKLGPEDAA